MATTQYVGARYVPLFAEPAQWDINKQYEPLTIVLDHGNSYTSRQFVPTGIELTNDAFWALTGNYNAQVEQYRQEVTAYDGRINTAQATADAAVTKATEADTKSTNANTAIEAEATRATAKEAEIQSLVETNDTDIAHLDAQMAATTGSELLNRIDANKQAIATEKSERTQYTSTFTSQLSGAADSGLKTLIDTESNRAKAAEAEIESKIGSIDKYDNMVTIGDSWLEGYGGNENYTSWGVLLAKKLGATNHYESYQGGCGFSHVNNSVNFNNLVDRARTNVADPNAVKLVVIAGGINDRSESITKLKTDSTKCVNNALTSFPNARVVVFDMLLAGRFISPKMIIAKNAISEGCAAASKQVTIFDNCFGWIYDNESMHADSYHPNQLGQNTVANYMATCIEGGNVVVDQGIVSVKDNGYTLDSSSYIFRQGVMCSGYVVASNQSIPQNAIVCKISRGYSPGAYYNSYTDANLVLQPLKIDNVDANYFGFASQKNGTANQMYISFTFQINDNE